jgi:hypothetical protein
MHVVHDDALAFRGGIDSQSRRFTVRRVSSSPLIQCSRIEVPEKS